MSVISMSVDWFERGGRNRLPLFKYPFDYIAAVIILSKFYELFYRKAVILLVYPVVPYKVTSAHFTTTGEFVVPVE